VHVAARLAVWFLGGVGLALAMYLTASALVNVRSIPPMSFVIGGLGFVGIELVAHLGLQLRGRPSFHNGRG
jgi:hypothetical protein